MPVGMGICGTEVLIPPNEINPNTVAAHAEEQQQHQGGYLCGSRLDTGFIIFIPVPDSHMSQTADATPRVDLKHLLPKIRTTGYLMAGTSGDILLNIVQLTLRRGTVISLGSAVTGQPGKAHPLSVIS
ncbi:hypothetical protein C8R44DRAFT_736728 [Mycena epipterygia]|nr:hypothetical protein C8R44DRAFT_736728 [Mycena epipterygia]